MSRNQVRIIGGAWRSRIIRFPAKMQLRPTPDRVRETVFNWLGQDLTGKSCLDLFAGSGALGFEAASRGARRVVLVEGDRDCCKALATSRGALAAASVELKCADALEFLGSTEERFDVVFLDPPFRGGYWPRVAPLLPRCMAPDALVYLEGAGEPEVPAGWELVKQGRAGQVRFQLLKRTEHERQGGVPGDV